MSETSVVLVPAKTPGAGDVALYLVVSRGPGPTDHGIGYLYASGSVDQARKCVASEAGDQYGDDLVMIDLGRMSAGAAQVDAVKRRVAAPDSDVWWVWQP